MAHREGPTSGDGLQSDWQPHQQQQEHGERLEQQQQQQQQQSRRPASDQSEQSPLLLPTSPSEIPGVDHELHQAALVPYQPTRREKTTAYLCFLVLGASVLLPWNLLIVVTPYFNYRLSSHEDSSPNAPPSSDTNVPSGPVTSTFASSFVPLIFTVSNLVLIVQATYSQQRKGFDNVEGRLFTSIAAMAGIILLLAGSTMLNIPMGLFYILLTAVSIGGAAVSAKLQSGSTALTTIFDDPVYMQGAMSGQGAIGFAVSITQLLAALGTQQVTSYVLDDSLVPTAESALPSEGDKLVASTFRFFLVSLVFTVIAAVSTRTLVQMRMYRRAMQRHLVIEHAALGNESSVGPAAPLHHKSSIWQVNRKIQHLGLALANSFVVTIGLFPGITSSVQAVNKDGAWSSSLIWIPFGFVLFNTSDWIGRALPGFKRLVFTNKRNLVLASVARTLFIPLLLECNTQLGDGHRTVLFSSDAAFVLIMILFGISNGYLTSLLMMRAITEPELHPDEVDVASSIMLIYLTGGLSLGAVLSFFLQSIIR